MYLKQRLLSKEMSIPKEKEENKFKVRMFFKLSSQYDRQFDANASVSTCFLFTQDLEKA